METIRQRITIHPDHKVNLYFELPSGFPNGDAEVLVILNPLTQQPKQSPVTTLGSLSHLFGTLTNCPAAKDPVAFQRECRDEW